MEKFSGKRPNDEDTVKEGKNTLTKWIVTTHQNIYLPRKRQEKEGRTGKCGQKKEGYEDGANVKIMIIIKELK